MDNLEQILNSKKNRKAKEVLILNIINEISSNPKAFILLIKNDIFNPILHMTLDVLDNNSTFYLRNSSKKVIKHFYNLGFKFDYIFTGGTNLLMLCTDENIAKNIYELDIIPLDHIDNEGNNILHYFCRYRFYSLIKDIISRNLIDSYKQNNNGYTPLMFLIENGIDEGIKYLEILNLLIANSNLEVFNNKNESALMISIYNNKLKTANILFDICPEAVYRISTSGYDCLILCIDLEYNDLVDKIRNFIFNKYIPIKIKYDSKIKNIVIDDNNQEYINMKNYGLPELYVSKYDIEFAKENNTKQFYLIETDNYIKDNYLTKEESLALRNYSHIYDGPINSYLRNGILTEEDIPYNMLHLSLKEFKIKIKEKINLIDRIFQKISITTEENILWRGGLFHNSDDKIYLGMIKGYISTSRNFEIAKTFATPSKNFILQPKGFIYKIFVPPGIPIINMELYSNFDNEEEILLPKNCSFNLINSYPLDENITIYEVEIEYKYVSNKMNIGILEII